MTEKKELTIRKFMLKKFPPKKYFDCPIPKEYWDLFDEYAQQQLIDARVDELELLNSTIETALEQNLNKVETLTYNSVILKNKLRIKKLRGE